MSEDPHVGPQDGSVHEEAVRLLGALGEWAHQQRPAAEASTIGEECRYCPVCQLIHLARQTSPEVQEHLTTAATALVQAAAELLATRPGADGARGSGGAGGSAVERIDLDEGPSRPTE